MIPEFDTFGGFIFSIGKSYNICDSIYTYEDWKQDAYFVYHNCKLSFNANFNVKFISFFGQALKNEAKVKYNLRRKNANLISLDDIVHENLTIETMCADEDHFMDDLYNQDIINIINRIISKLKADDRILIQKVSEGAEQVEIAKILNVSQPMISRRLKRILATCKEEAKSYVA